MENIKGMVTCKVCGRDFPLLVEEHYISKEAGKTGIAALAGGLAPILWDSFNCPHCGSQNCVNQRNRISNPYGEDFPFEPIGDCEADEEDDCCCCGSDACKLNIGEQN